MKRIIWDVLWIAGLENRVYSLEKALEIAGAQAISAMDELREFKSEHSNCSKSRGDW